LELLLSEKEKTYCTFNNLDNRITVKEISSAIASLKNSKAKGLDLISNEMLKGGNAKLLLCLTCVFLMVIILTHGLMATSLLYLNQMILIR
jgi:hypothetical protein